MEKENSAKNYCIKCILKETLHLEPHLMTKNIKKILTKLLKEKVGNKCIKDGYVLKDSVNIVKYSIGEMFAAHFTGCVRYTILYTADLYNPCEKMDILCTIVNKNKMGILAEAGFHPTDLPAPISILLSKQHHLESDTFKELDIGKEIMINVIGKRFELNDKQIFVIGKLNNMTVLAGGANKKNIEFNSENINKLIVSPWLTDGLPKTLEAVKISSVNIPSDIKFKFQKIIDRLYSNPDWNSFEHSQKVTEFFKESKFSPLFAEEVISAINQLSNEKNLTETEALDNWYKLTDIERKNYIIISESTIIIQNTLNYTPSSSLGLFTPASTAVDDNENENENDSINDVSDIDSQDGGGEFSDEEFFDNDNDNDNDIDIDVVSDEDNEINVMRTYIKL